MWKIQFYWTNILLTNFEKPSAYGRGNPHDDAFTDTLNLINMPMDSCIKQMICGFFKRCQHEHTVLHLSYANPANQDPRTKKITIILFIMSTTTFPTPCGCQNLKACLSLPFLFLGNVELLQCKNLNI
jgi:hypothetical protein